MISTSFNGAAQACQETFGFSATPVPDKAAMPDKIDAYLLLRDDPDSAVAEWAGLIGTIYAMGAKKSDASTEMDDQLAASAAVAASEDPDSYTKAESRYMEGALAPFRRALNACSAVKQDPFLGKYYLTGSGSIEKVEKSMRDYFSELVASLKSEKPKR